MRGRLLSRFALGSKDEVGHTISKPGSLGFNPRALANIDTSGENTSALTVPAMRPASPAGSVQMAIAYIAHLRGRID